MIDFRIVPHSIRPGVRIVEVLLNGAVVGTISPGDRDSIRVISAHIAETATEEGFAGEVIEDDGSSHFPPIPHVEIVFKTSPWVIRGGRIAKIPDQ